VFYSFDLITFFRVYLALEWGIFFDDVETNSAGEDTLLMKTAFLYNVRTCHIFISKKLYYKGFDEEKEPDYKK